MRKGIAASPGIEIGKALVIKKDKLPINKENIWDGSIDEQLTKLRAALEQSKRQLIDIQEKTKRKQGKDKAQIFEAHLMILEDPVFIEEIRAKIKKDRITAEYAVNQVTEDYVEIFENMEDEYLKSRAVDVKDVSERIIRNILGLPTDSLQNISDNVILLANDLTPSDTAQMDKEKILAFATDTGSRTSHTAIMARSLEIPAVVGLTDITGRVKNGDLVIVDGNLGIIYINPDVTTLEKYKKTKDDYLKYRFELKKIKNSPATTYDGLKSVKLAANIGTPVDVQRALENGAEGIGLFRTEFLYMDRKSLPTEEEQFLAYKDVAEKMAPHPIIIRTLDIGGDKRLPYLDMPEELNPFLGWRAIRMCLDRPEILKTQLRAILRASHYGEIKIMYPMISQVSEIRKAKEILQEAKEELKAENVPFKELEVGIMVEIPSAAIAADIMAKEVDFFSIGTNDLIQYTLAVDRMNEHIAHLYEPFHPAILRLIKNVIDASHEAGHWTGMCGEMAGNILATPILLGLGLDEFSMSASSILPVKRIIRNLSMKKAKEIAEKALTMENGDEIRHMVEEALSS